MFLPKNYFLFDLKSMLHFMFIIPMHLLRGQQCRILHEGITNTNKLNARFALAAKAK